MFSFSLMRTAAGGVLHTKVNDLSSYTVISDRDDGAGLVLRLGVERLAELHDVDALGAEGRADRRSRVGGTRGDLQLDKAGLLLFSHESFLSAE